VSPSNVVQQAQYTEKEILKFPVGLHAKKSVVLDGNAFAVPATGDRYFVPVGTILKRVGDKHIAYDGTGVPAGILARNVDLLVQATAGSEPAPMFFFGCIFATQAIVSFTQYQSALAVGLPSCRWE